MICKYRYKGQFFSEQDIRKELGDEFFENEVFKIREYESSGAPMQVFSPIRRISLHETFKDDVNSLIEAQDVIITRMGELVYLGSLNDPQGYIKEVLFDLEEGQSVMGDTVKRKFYVPETLAAAAQILYKDIEVFIKYVNDEREAGEDVSEHEQMYNALSKLSNYNNFYHFISTIYPESKNIISEVQEEVLGDNTLQTIFNDIRDNIKIDQEKSQSKYVKFLTNFIEYKTIDNENNEVFGAIKESSFSYAILLEALSGSFNTENLIGELKRNFRKLVNLDADISDLSEKKRKIVGIYNKLTNLITFQMGQSVRLEEHPIFKSMRFVGENEFVFDIKFKQKIHNIYDNYIDRNQSNIVSVERIGTKGSNIENTYSFVKRATAAVNKAINENPAVSDMVISEADMSYIWTYNYNKMALADLFSLLSSQRNSNGKMTNTKGAFGEITVTNKPISKKASSYDLRSIFSDRLLKKFLFKEDIDTFKESNNYKNISNLIEGASVAQKLKGIELFNKIVLEKPIPKGTTLEDKDIKLLAQQITFFLNKLGDVTMTSDKQEYFNKITESGQEIFDENEVYSSNIISDSANTIVTMLSDYYDEGGQQTKRAMASSADGTSFFVYHLGSYIERLHDHVVDSINFETTVNEGNKIAEKIALNVHPELDSKWHPHNPIGKKNGIKIGKLHLYRGHQYYSYPVMYQRERTNDWFLREFSAGFIAKVRESSDTNVTYDHFYSPISNKPNAKMVELSVSNSTEMLKWIKNVLTIIETRPKELNGLIKNYNSEDTLLFRVIDDVKKEGKVTPEKIYKKLMEYAVDSAQDFVVANELHITKDIRTVEKKLIKTNTLDVNHLNILTDVLKSKGLLNKDQFNVTKNPKFSFGTKVKNEDNTSSKTYKNSTNEFIEVYSLFYLNHYINTFLVGDLFVGDAAFFKHENDYIKRLSIPYSPGNSLFVEEEFSQGAKREYNMVVLKEFDTDAKKDMEALFKELLSEAVTEDEREFLVNMFTNYDRADAQGFMLPRRLEDVRAGLGSSYSQGSALKPVVYTKRVMKTTSVDKKGKTITKEYLIPTAVKYASFVLEPKFMELLEDNTPKFPNAFKMVKWMEANNIDETVFQSGVKVGSADPKHLYGLKDILDMNPKSDEYTSISKDNYNEDLKDDLQNNRKLGFMTLSNKDYRIQQNPTSNKKFNKEGRAPTQMIYVINMAASSDKAINVSAIYQDFADIMDIQGEELKNTLTGNKLDDSVVSSKLFSDVLEQKMSGPGNEGFAEFITQGVNVNMPALLQKGTIQFSSFISDEILSTKFPGGKFQLVSDVLYNNPQTGKPLEIVKDPKTGKVMYGEILIAKKWKSKVAVDSLLGIDGLTVRIPTSGLHSTMPFKVVGYIDEDSDIFVGPRYMTPVQGSDFDADAVFVIRDITWDDFKEKISKRLMDKQMKESLNEYLINRYGKNPKMIHKLTLESSDEQKKQYFKEIDSLLIHMNNNFPKKFKPSLEKAFRKEMTLNFHKQNIITNLKIIISEVSDHNVKEMLSPIYMDLINGKVNSIYKYIADERNVGIDDLLVNLDLSRSENKNIYFHRNFDGNALTGIFANLFKAVSYMDKAGTDRSRPRLMGTLSISNEYNTDLTENKLLNPSNKLEKGFKTAVKKINYRESGEEESLRESEESFVPQIIDGETKSYNQMQENTTFLGKPYAMRTLMDIFINLAIDNVSEQGLPTINASSQTASVYVLGLSLGIPLEDMVSLMLSPMAKKISYFKKRNASSLVQSQLETIYEEKGFGNDLKKDSKEAWPIITKALLKKQVSYKNERLESLDRAELLEQYALSQFFNKLEVPATELNEISMNFSVIQDMKVNFKDIEKLVNYFKSKIKYDKKKQNKGVRDSVYLSELNPEDVAYKSQNFDMSELFKSAPHVFKSIVYQRMMYDYISEVLHVYNQNKHYKDFLKKLEINVSHGFNQEDRVDFLRKEILHFMAASSPEVKDIRDYPNQMRHPHTGRYMTRADTWQFHFATKIKNLQEKTVGNSFLDALQVNFKSGAGWPFISLSDGKSMDPIHMYEVQTHFKLLPESVQKEFIKYAIYFYGAKYGSANFVMAISGVNYADWSKSYSTLLMNVLKNNKDGQFDVVKDVMEIQIMINSFDKLFTFNKEAITRVSNAELKLVTGDIMYYDMVHDSDVLPEGFQMDRAPIVEEADKSTLNDLKNEDDLDPEDLDTRFIGAKNKYVTFPMSNGNGGYMYTIYRRLDVPTELLEGEASTKDYYKYVGNVENSKNYTFDSDILAVETPETKSYDINKAFNPFMPSKVVGTENLKENKFEQTIFGKSGFKKGVNIILYDHNDLTRQFAKVYQIEDIVNTKEIIGKETRDVTKITYIKVDDVLLPVKTLETEFGTYTGVESVFAKKEIENKKDILNEGGITEQSCQ